MPKFQGSDDFTTFKNHVATTLQYPEEAVKKNIQGKVFLQFIVDTDGKVKDAKVVRSADPLLDKEALRTVSNSPVWEPGKQRGKKVAVQFTMPVVFKLQDEAMENMQDETVVVSYKTKLPDDILYMIDGKATTSNILKEMDPDDIESIEVIKGEKAEQLYGNLGKHGVVIISTKETSDKEVSVVNFSKINEGKDILIFINDKSASLEEMEKIDKEDIESITVLKGKQAIEEYGEKAKDGVILIYLK
jgi:TonB family protein